MSQRDMFSELIEGFAAMQAHREGKLSQYFAKQEAKPVAAPAKTPATTAPDTVFDAASPLA
ncbi:hypothetical protein [Polaromonas jejuensis]|uniref:Uncharacterized protein n=1 Tax=Polaromonas jejuensis TaxID=457502 RepID=A0ABW0QFF9_9BURK|nr:hypothetical protein [Polaromonas jejuensis]